MRFAQARIGPNRARRRVRVHDRLEERVGRLLAAWVGRVQRNPWRVIAAFALAIIGSVVYAVENLGIRGDTDVLFASDIPFRVAEQRYYDAFPGQYENIFVVVDGATPDRATAAA